MNLVSPAALAFAALAVPIVVLYILKIRLRRVPVSTLLFWQQIFEEENPRSIWQRLRHLISLLLQLAFLSLLVVALADPIFRWQQARARRLVLVVDNSASMNARDVAPSRLAAAKDEAGRWIGGLRLGDELALIAAGTQPQVYCGLTDHQRTLRQALEAIPATDGPTQVAEAVALARRLVSAADKPHQIVVLSDGGFDGAAGLAAEKDVQLVALGSRRTGNVGITRMQARRSLLDPVGYEILVEIQCAGDEPVECRLELDLEGDPIDVLPLKLKPGEPLTQVFNKASAEGGRLRARLNRDDALAADNTAHAILPRRPPRPVTLITEGNLFLEKVFEAIPLVALTVDKAPPAPPASPAAAGREPALTVFHRKVPAVLPAGPVMVIEPAESGPLWKVDEPIQNPVVAKQEKDSPLLAHVQLDQVLMPEARKLTFPGPARVLVESATGDPLYAVIDRPEGQVIVLTVNLDKGDLPLQTAFPIMMTNVLGWLGGSRSELREALATGAVTSVELPVEAEPGASRFLRAPDGQERPLATGPARVVVGPLDRCGVWGIVRRAPTARKTKDKDPAPATTLAELACNLSNRRESDLRPAEGLPTRAAGGTANLGTRPIWYYLVASAWLLTCWEWLLYQRRWID
jgi:hypothetical protein